MFSELVDACVRVSGRPDCLIEITRMANEVMREISKRDDWPDDLVEERVYRPPDTQAAFLWTPEVGRLRFRREHEIVDGCGCKVAFVRPSARMKEFDRFYYRSGESFVFSTNVCEPVNIAYYAYQPWRRYYPVGSRPSVFNLETQEYDNPMGIDAVSNWLLERHNSVVEAGTLAKFFASKSDPRQQVHYSIYQQGISHIIRAESTVELEANS